MTRAPVGVAAPSAAPGALLPPVRATFRAVVETVVPEAQALDEAAWRECEAIVEQALAFRPLRLQRQLVVFLRAIDALARVRHLRAFARLKAHQRDRLLKRLQAAPLGVLRRGTWGVRTLALMGYYARPAAAGRIGYRADPRGWSAAP